MDTEIEARAGKTVVDGLVRTLQWIKPGEHNHGKKQDESGQPDTPSAFREPGFSLQNNKYWPRLMGQKRGRTVSERVKHCLRCREVGDDKIRRRRKSGGAERQLPTAMSTDRIRAKVCTSLWTPVILRGSSSLFFTGPFYLQTHHIWKHGPCPDP
jgi:hypothetical protein